MRTANERPQEENHVECRAFTIQLDTFFLMWTTTENNTSRYGFGRNPFIVRNYRKAKQNHILTARFPPICFISHLQMMEFSNVDIPSPPSNSKEGERSLGSENRVTARPASLCIELDRSYFGSAVVLVRPVRRREGWGGPILFSWHQYETWKEEKEPILIIEIGRIRNRNTFLLGKSSRQAGVFRPWRHLYRSIGWPFPYRIAIINHDYHNVISISTNDSFNRNNGLCKDQCV